MPFAAGQARAVDEAVAEVVELAETETVEDVAVLDVLVEEGQAEGPVFEGKAYMFKYPPLPQYSVELPPQVIEQFVASDETLEHATVFPQ